MLLLLLSADGDNLQCPRLPLLLHTNTGFMSQKLKVGCFHSQPTFSISKACFLLLLSVIYEHTYLPDATGSNCGDSKSHLPSLPPCSRT